MRKRKIRILAVVLAVLLMVFQGIPGSGFSWSKTVKAADNPYSGGYSNCTWTAWKMCYEATGHALPSWDYAGTWWESAQNAGYTTSTVPRANSVAVWWDNYGGLGHVGWVSDVSADGTQIYVKEGGFEGGYHEGWVGVSELRDHNTQYLKGFIYIGSTNADPIGSYDTCVGGTGTITITGWAYDPDTPSQSIAIHVYVGGSIGDSNAEVYGVPANQASPDVNSQHSITGNHRFSATIPVTKSGSQPVYVYAINSSEGNNPLLGCRTTTITADSEKPVISNPVVTNIDSSGYTVSCTVTDNVGIKRVLFPSWSRANGQDDITWYEGTINGNTASARVKASDHGVGEMVTHIYAYDHAGNVSDGAVSQEFYPNEYIIIPCSTHSKVFVPAKTATPQEDGNIAHWYCERCNTYFLEDGSTIVNRKDVIVPIPYADVSVRPGNWAYEGILFAFKKGLMSGSTDKNGVTTFRPKDNITRAEFVTILYRMAGSPKVLSSGDPFTDVKQKANGSKPYYYDAVVWAKAVGVITGYPDGTFGTKNNITRADMAVTLMRYASDQGIDTGNKANITGMPDYSNVPKYARDAVAWANAYGIITGREKSGVQYLAPRENAQRQECATILQRFYNAFEIE